MKLFLLIVIAFQLSSCNQDAREDVLFIGDSHIYKWDVNHNFPYINAYNEGIVGEKIEALHNRINADSCSKYDRIIVQTGINNVLSFAADINRLDEEFENMRLLVDSILFTMSQVESDFIFMSTIPFDHAYFNTDVICNKIQLHNEYLALSTENYSNITFVDLAKVITNDGNCLDRALLVDDLHLNSFGYSRISNLIRRFF